MSTPGGPPYADASQPGAPYPEPPYPPELLADLHAGALPDDVAAHVTARLVDDPAGRDVLAALDRTAAQLHGLPVETRPVPPAVDARTRATLAALRNPPAASQPAPPPATGHPQHAAAPPPTAPPQATPPRTGPPNTTPPGTDTPVTDLARRRRRPRGPLTTGLLAAAAAVVAVLAVTATLVVRNSPAPQAPSQAQPSTTAPETPPGAGTGPRLDPTSQMAALAVLGRTDGAPFGSTAALRRCTAANGIPDDTPVVGSGEITVDGARRAIILLGTGVAGRFTALVVEPECDTGNPAFVSRTVIGG